MLFIGLVLSLTMNCAYKPVGIISKVNENTYSTTCYGADAATAAQIANADAKATIKLNTLK